MKKASLFLVALFCLTACAQPTVMETSSSTQSAVSSEPVSITPDSSANPSEGSSKSVQTPDLQIQKLAEDLLDPTFMTHVVGGENSYGKPRSDDFRKKLANLLLESPHETTELFTHGTLEAETDPYRIIIEVLSDERWTQVEYYLLPDSYGDLAGKVYIEVTPSNEIVQGLYYYELDKGSYYLYEGNVYEETVALIEQYPV